MGFEPQVGQVNILIGNTKTEICWGGLSFDFQAALTLFPFLMLFLWEAYASLTKRVQGLHITQGSVTYSAHRGKRCRSNFSWTSEWFEPMSYDCVEALNATQRRDICPFINVQMWKTFNKLFTFILVYLWTEAVSAVSSPVSPAKPLPSAGAQGVMGRRKVRLFSLCSRRTRYEDDLGTSPPKAHTFYMRWQISMDSLRTWVGNRYQKT